MKITVASRNPKSNKFPFTLELTGNDVKTSDINKEIFKKFSKYSPERQRLTTEDKKVLDTDKTLSEQGITHASTIYFKDLGPQIGWRTVFMIEYAGPLVFQPIFYYFGKYIYGSSFEHSAMQTATFYMNSAHYWFLSGINLAFWVFGPWFAQGKIASERSDVWLWGCVAVWAWAEISNLITHITLRNLRPPGTRVRAIPYGYGFDLVSCPNYLFETIGWTAVCFLTTSWSAFLFNIVATGQMYVWAVKKHKNYKKEFKEYPHNRTSMIPFLA
ncbi:unnamed protein product [Mucor hiemalis]